MPWKRQVMCVGVATIVCGVLLSGCRPVASAVADEQAIRDADERYNDAIVQRDLDKMMSVYAPNAVSMSPGDPPEHGVEAIRAAWRPLLATPGFKLQIIPEKIDIARAGDMALELGHTEVEGTLSNGPLKAKANYVVGWQKLNGQWKITHETFVPDRIPIPPPSGFGPPK
jgi:uncharacterized protein (TIGR02246 family)